MTSSRPYLIRAMHEWLVDNELTPYLMVDTTVAACEVPEDYIEDDRIILNISPRAVRALSLENDKVTFDARFSGVIYNIVVPIVAVLAIYASENGRGMVFEGDDEDTLPPNDTSPDGSGVPKPDGSSKPNLRIVK